MLVIWKIRLKDCQLRVLCPCGETPRWWASVLNCSVMSDSCDPIDWSLPGSSVSGILQARIQEWVAISFSRGSSQPRGWTQVSCIAVRLHRLSYERSLRWAWATFNLYPGVNAACPWSPIPATHFMLISRRLFSTTSIQGEHVPLPTCVYVHTNSTTLIGKGGRWSIFSLAFIYWLYSYNQDLNLHSLLFMMENRANIHSFHLFSCAYLTGFQINAMGVPASLETYSHLTHTLCNLLRKS